MSYIGKRLRARRLAISMTQEELARRASVSRAIIAKTEGGAIHSPRVGTLSRIAAALGCTVGYLADTETTDNAA